jgi:hypothetical protein
MLEGPHNAKGRVPARRVLVRIVTRSMILLIAGISLVIAGIGLLLASMIVMLMRDHKNDAHIDAEQKAPLSAELASPRARPEVNPAPAEEPQRGPAEPYDKEAAKATLESFVPNVQEGTHTSRPIGPH